MLINVTGFFRDRCRFRLSGQRASFPASCTIIRWIGRSESGSPVAVPARRPIPSRCCFASRSTTRARDQTADLRQRRRCRRRRERSRRPLSALDRGRRLAGTPGPVLHSGRSRLPHLARPARERRVHGARRAGRPAIREARFRIVPEPAHLPAARGPGQGHLAVPLRLAESGLLLVGDAETVGVADGRFVVVSKPERLYRRVGGARPGDFALSSIAADGSRLRARPGPASTPSRQIDVLRTLSIDGAGGLRSGCGADQPEARMSVLSRTHRSIPQGRIGPPRR